MQENKFENQVRGIMDHLSFDPDEKVWENVGKKIDEDRKRRRPIFWIFLLTGALVAGSGYFLLINHASKSLHTVQTGLQSPAMSNSASPEINITPVPEDSENEIRQKTAALEMPDVTRGQTQKNFTKKSSSVSSNTGTSDLDVAQSAMNRNSGNSPSALLENKTEEAQQSLPEGAQPNSQGPDQEPVETEKKESREMQDHPVPPPIEKTSHPVAQQAAQQQKLPAGKLSFGIFASPGIPVIHSSYSGSSYANAPATSGGSVNNNTPPSGPEVKSGFSWSAGVFASKNLSSKISLSAGLNYHYVSTKSEISSNPSSAYSRIYYAAAAAPNFPSTTYTNQYHYVGIPLWVDFTLNKNPAMLLVWEAGFSAEWLAGTNALYYDPSSGVYYENSSKINHTLWSASTAFLVGFNKGRLQAGPQLQYGLNSMVQPPSSQNLLSWNLKISWKFR